MLVLLLLVIFGLGMSYFATQNTGLVHVVFGSYLVQGIPLYIIVIGALILGIFISWLINIVESLSSTITIHGKVSQIKKANEVINKLQLQVHEVELENARLKAGNNSEEPVISASKPQEEIRPTFFTRLTRQLSIQNDKDAKIKITVR
jgi:uncharacterized protein HemY